MPNKVILLRLYKEGILKVMEVYIEKTYDTGYTYMYIQISGFYGLLEQFKSHIESFIDGCFGKISVDKSIYCIKTKAHKADSFMSLLYDSSSEKQFSQKYKKYKELM